MMNFSQLTPQFTPTHYDLSLTLERQERTFHGTVTITGQFNGEDYLALHAKDLSIETALFDGKTADFATSDNDELHISHQDLAQGEHIITLGFSGTITDAMHGLYPCYYTADGVKKELLATQFESHHAREVFPCIDEPAAKATFDLTLTTEDNITVLGNMPAKWQRTEPEGLVTKFETTPKMSPYLLAWVTGELHKKTAHTKDGVEVNVWATPAQSPESLDFALETSVKCIEFYNDYFDVAYPLPKCDHVALPDFSSGAMENWGLITYRETCLIANKSTSIDAKRYIAMVVCHELSHQWFGNLVTMQWWDDLWLNESFANMMEYAAVDALYPEWNIYREYSASESLSALRRDSLDGVQSVHVEVTHPDEISTLFDPSIVYAKGSRLMRMLQTHIGHEAFSAGLQSYFKKYAYQNTVGQNLWDELSVTSGKDISGLMNTWISQPGFPVVSIDQNNLLSQKQFFIGEHTPSDRIWPIPLNATDKALPVLFDVKERSVQAPNKGFRLNDKDTAHFITNYTNDQLAPILADIKSGSVDEITRLQILHERTLLAQSGDISTAELVSLLDAYRSEQSNAVWGIIGLAIGELRKVITGDDEAEASLKQFTHTLATPQYERLGWQQRTNEPEDDTTLRGQIISLMLYAEDSQAINKAHELYESTSLEAMDAELRSAIIANEVRNFDSDGTISVKLLDRYKKESNGDIEQDICLGLTATKNKDTAKILLDSMQNSDVIRKQDIGRWFVYLIRNKYTRSYAWQWLQDEWQWLEAQFASDKSMDMYPRYAASGLRTAEEYEEYVAFFMPHKENPSLARSITLGERTIKSTVALIDRDREKVKNALEQM